MTRGRQARRFGRRRPESARKSGCTGQPHQSPAEANHKYKVYLFSRDMPLWSVQDAHRVTVQIRAHDHRPSTKLDLYWFMHCDSGCGARDTVRMSKRRWTSDYLLSSHVVRGYPNSRESIRLVGGRMRRVLSMAFGFGIATFACLPAMAAATVQVVQGQGIGQSRTGIQAGGSSERCIHWRPGNGRSWQSRKNPLFRRLRR